jgi:hypothetical protein
MLFNLDKKDGYCKISSYFYQFRRGSNAAETAAERAACEFKRFRDGNFDTE